MVVNAGSLRKVLRDFVVMVNPQRAQIYTTVGGWSVNEWIVTRCSLAKCPQGHLAIYKNKQTSTLLSRRRFYLRNPLQIPIGLVSVVCFIIP